MSVAAVAKIAGASGVVAGIPATYFVWDKYFSLNSIENAILENVSSEWTITSQTNPVKVSATASSTAGSDGSVTYNWSCDITATKITNDNVSKFVNYLKSKLNKDQYKQHNRRYLVKECSKNRISGEENNVKTNVKSTLSLDVELIDNGNKIFTYLFGEGSTAESQ